MTKITFKNKKKSYFYINKKQTKNMKTYIAYYRVSTQKQNKSGLGLSSQKQMINNYIKDKSQLLAEYQEAESGKLSTRPQLQKAIEHCKKTDSTLIIAKLDRLSRNVKFIYTLKESNIKFICADTPEANNLTIGLLAVIAEDEAQRISDRTSKALQEIKKNIKQNGYHISKSGNRITSLGAKQNLTKEAKIKGNLVMKKKALSNPDNTKAARLIISLKKENKPYCQIAEILNESGFKTVRGNQFYPTQVRNLYQMFNSQFV